MTLELVTGKPDKEVAAEIRSSIEDQLTTLCKAFDESERQGFTVAFNVGKSPVGKWMITALLISKPF